MSRKGLLVHGWMATNGVGAVGLAAAQAPAWTVVAAGASPTVWGATAIVLTFTSVFAKKKARREAAYRTLKLITG
ncbi:hypothetical protein [Nocardia sp. SC052]|uniref:hypothetical protein n=1 Tax=Nocardia sichangensis TaxID=3385975 RepID=UPI0039A09451